MAGITLAQAQAKLDEWMAADTAVANGQSATYKNGAYARVDAATIQSNIQHWDRKVRCLTRGGARRVRMGVPLG